MTISPPSRPASSVAGTDPAPARIVWLDRLKAILVADIIAGHAILAYGTLENAWPYQPVQEVTLGHGSEVVVDLIVIPVAMFAMGLFFLMSGLVTPAALARRGVDGFARRRLVRYGGPLLVWTLLIWPGAIWASYRAAGRTESFAHLWLHHEPFLDTGPMWFVLVLLIYSLGYAGWSRWGRWSPARTGRRNRAPIDTRVLVALAAAISVANLLVRPVLPAAGNEIFQLHVWQWPQTLALFGLGIAAAGRGGLTPVGDRLRRAAGRMALGGLVAFALVAVAIAITGVDGGTIFESGLHWTALLLAAIEGPLCVGAAVWLLAMAQRHLAASPGRFLAAAERAAYGAFVAQGLVLTAFLVALRPLALPAEVKALLVAGLGVLGSFGLAWLLVSRTVLRRVL